tara:strand:+ start:680 stop:859 length:180 start_codon:yes stop_codon:yes gene_type:complete
MSIKKNKKTDTPMPSSSAGLLRFFEDETASVKIRPEIVVGTGIALMVVSLILRIYLPVI